MWPLRVSSREPLGIRSVSEPAAERRVWVGADPGYPELAGFDRAEMHVPGAEPCGHLINQMGVGDGAALPSGSTRREQCLAGPDRHHVQPHPSRRHPDLSLPLQDQPRPWTPRPKAVVL